MAAVTATVAGVTNALKSLFPGQVYRTKHDHFKLLNDLKKTSGYTGDGNLYVPIKNALSQGTGPDVGTAQGNLFSDNFVRFNLQRVNHYSIARISGELIEASQGREGSFVDQLKEFADSAAKIEMKCQAIYAYGAGDGVLGQMSSGHTTATVTMGTSVNMNYFDLNARYQAVSATGLSPTLRSGTARCTGIDRRNRTLTFSAALDTLISGVQATDYLVRDGDYATSSYRVTMGLEGYVPGGASPAALFSLTRSTDPVALAGQSISYTGVEPENALMDAVAQHTLFGGETDGLAIYANPIELALMKQNTSSKVRYTPGGDAKVGFGKTYLDTENGPVLLRSDPFCPRQKAFIIRQKDFDWHYLGKGVPYLVDTAGKFMQMPTEDSFEIRWACRGNIRCTNPQQVQLTGFGA